VISICYVVDAPFLGGAELYVSRLATGLDRRRFSPCVLMRENCADERLIRWREELRADGIPVHAVPMRLPFRPSDGVAIWRWFDHSAPHVVHVNMPGPYDGQMGLVVPIARAAGARTVVTEHLPMVERLWKRAWIKSLAYRGLDLGVSMTRVNAHFLVERQGVPENRVRVVANGVPRRFGTDVPDRGAARARAGIPSDRVALLYVGNILRYKGLYRLIEALSNVSPAAVPRPWCLAVVGTGPDEARCRERADALGLRGDVLMLGHRDAAEVEAIMAACDVIALPSEIEGLPYVVLEAMACSRPVVAGRVFGVPEAVDDEVTGLLVDPTREQELVAALERLVQDSELRQRMGRAARARFERDFTLEMQVERMESLYEQLVAGRDRRGNHR